MKAQSSPQINHQAPALPVQPGERIEAIDILRGFAVFGILAANMASFSGHTTNIPQQLTNFDSWVLILIRFFVTAKFYSLFSFLFGWGLSAQMARSRTQVASFTSLYLRRLLILLLIGVVHGIFIWGGDILTTYAILGFFLFLMRKKSQRTILVSVIICLLLTILLNAPWKIPTEIVSRYEDLTAFMRLNLVNSDVYSRGSYLEITQLRIEEYLRGLSRFLIFFGNLFSMFLLGLLTGKRRIFQEIDRHVPLLYKVLLGGFIIGVLGNVLNIWLIRHPGSMPFDWLPQSYHRMIQHIAYTLGAPALMLFYVSGIVLFLRNKYWQNLLSPLRYVGRMALSNYLLQSVIATLIFYNYGLGLFGEISPTFGLILTGLIFVAQIRISGWWFEHHSYGPMEWVWRTLTYGIIPQSQSEVSGVLKIISDRANKIFQSVKQIHPLWILSFSWIVLLVWAGLLINWNQMINVRNQLPSLRQAVSEIDNPASIATSTEQAEQAGEVGQRPIAVPTFEQKPYLPQNIAAKGNVEALVDTFNLDLALLEIEKLTDVLYGGRQAGSPQGQAAGDYIASQFSHYGLQPLGDQDSYFQEFFVTYTPLEEIPSLYLETPNNTTPEHFTAYQDFTPIVRWYAGSGVGKGQVYWLNRCNEEDFATQDLLGKVLLCMPDMSPNWLAIISRRAMEYGAAALLILTDPEVRPPDFGWSFKDVWVPEPLPVFFVYPDMVSKLLEGSEQTLSTLQANTQPFPLENSVGFEIKTIHTSSCPGTKCVARNVIGILPGRDPGYANEAIILGAHYDHMGQTPNGIIWPGANDDASGVAVLLEIARSWQEQGYIPKRSVIFIAWDAEELGLLGSIHYVMNPLFPLENTLAMIQLDMIGAGSTTLVIDGTTSLSDKIKHVAENYGINTQITDTGGSDHIPFINAGVPASALIWETPSDEISTYHLPDDTVDEIDGERLQSAALIAEHITLNLVESEPSIQEMLTTRAIAAQEGNVEAFLSSSHPNQVTCDKYWLQDLLSLQPKRVSMEAGELLITGNDASANVRIDVDYWQTSATITHTLTARIPVAFSYEPSGWKWNGIQLEWSEIDKQDERTFFTVGYPSGKESSISGVERSAVEEYQRITGLLGLSPEIQARLLIVNDKEILWGSTALSQPKDRYTSVVQGEIKLVYSEAISTSLRLQDSLVQLAMAEAGVSETLAPWLWQGLPLVLQANDQPITTQINLLPALQESLVNGSPPTDMVRSWAATSYLHERLGWTGIGKFIVRLGQRYQEGHTPEQALDATLDEFLNSDAEEFEIAWQNAWQLRLTAAQNAIDTLLSSRNLAISNGDLQDFLRTIDRRVPNLEIEETHWFQNIQTNQPVGFSLTGHPLAFIEDGSLLAEIILEYQPAEEEQSSTSFNILLTPSEAGYYWAGPMMDRIQGERADILYPSDEAELASVFLSQTDQLALKLSSVLDLPLTNKLVIKLYATTESYDASISIPSSQTIIENAWTLPGESIKLNIIGNSDPEDYSSVLADYISRSLLYQNGITPSWLTTGIGTYLSRPYARESSGPRSRQQTAELYEAIHSGVPIDLYNTILGDGLTREELEFYQSAAQDAIDFLVSNYGWDALIKILKTQSYGSDLESALQSTLNTSFETFRQSWLASLQQKHIHPEWVDTAQDFSPGEVIESIDYLSSPALEGRLAGSPGSETAAQFIADAFKAYGLLPVGGLRVETVSPIDLQPSTNEANPISSTLPTFFQTFPISYTQPTSTPTLELLGKSGETLVSLTYRQDFLVVQADACTGTVIAPLVWGGNQAYPNSDYEGNIILRTASSDIPGEINTATSHGATALLLTNKLREPKELFAKQPLSPQDSIGASIPVFEVTQPGYSRLLEAFGLDRQSISNLAAFQHFNGLVRFDCTPNNFETVQTNNVLGLLPGSDPYLSQEVIILSAHYDHVGNDPDGLRYSGANDDASGVAALIEIARIFHEQDYQPKRSILFVAWGAQEQGQLGSSYFISHPAFPLQNIIGMIQLDGIGGGDGFNLGIQGLPDSDSDILFYLQAAEQALWEKLIYTTPFYHSDDTSFRQVGIPSVLISWRLANEANLPDELGNAIHPDRLGVAGRVTTLLLMALAR